MRPFMLSAGPSLTFRTIALINSSSCFLDPRGGFFLGLSRQRVAEDNHRFKPVYVCDIVP